jgi:hypothetical protein
MYIPHKCLNPCEVQYFLGKKNDTNVVTTPKKRDLPKFIEIVIYFLKKGWDEINYKRCAI